MATAGKAQIKSRPNPKGNLGSTTTGLRNTGLDTEHDGLLFVPESYDPKKPSPLIVMLHGAGGEARQSIEPLRDLAERTRSIVLAPESQESTWDVIVSDFGEDVYFIDEALSDVFALYNIDTDRIAIGGFSDGASYALSLGLYNTDLFTHILAFSPGFVRATVPAHGPEIFVSHGTDDKVLPIDSCSRSIVPRLKEAGLNVTYYEFKDGHTIPADVGRKAFVWFLGLEAIDETRGAKLPAHEAGIEYT